MLKCWIDYHGVTFNHETKSINSNESLPQVWGFTAAAAMGRWKKKQSVCLKIYDYKIKGNETLSYLIRKSLVKQVVMFIF